METLMDLIKLEFKNLNIKRLPIFAIYYENNKRF